jgi:16S rRNA C967 or C1407 C5-methylase (RsmB/RsmF family)
MGKDATLDSSFRPLTYDKILLDAPCSSERHVLHQLHKQDSASNLHKDLLNWSPSSSDKIAKNLQLKMLINAVNALKFGGSLVYSTCSLSPSENDGVVENMLKAIDKQNRKRVKEAAARRQRRNAGDAHDEDLEDSHQQQEAEPEEQGTRAQPTDDQEPQPELWKVEVVPTSWSIGEPTTHGWMILPDQQQGAGWGPIYFCKIVKRRKKRQGLS